MKNKLISILKYVFLFLLFFFLVEILCRIFFKEFNDNNIFYDENKFHRISKGIDTYYKYTELTKDFKFRVKDKNSELKFNKKIRSIWFIGDSVTNGYGVKYEDTYWDIVSQSLNKENKKHNVYSVSNYGANYSDIIKVLDLMLKHYASSNDILIYQFNYNDILDVLEGGNLNAYGEKPSSLFRNKLIRSTQQIRYKYLNRSTFIKIIQHYASVTPYKTKGSCSYRGIDALGPYTYAYFSKGYEKVSETLWNDYLKSLKKLNFIAKEKKIKFYVLISPLSLQLKNHEKINKLNYDLNCGTIDARKYLIKYLNNNKINYIDPYYNFQEAALKLNILFHNFDENHPNALGHKIIGETILESLKF